LPTKYPDAEVGLTAMVRDTGKVYRYEGLMWKEIQDIDPTAINEVDSRLTSQLAQLPTQEQVNAKRDKAVKLTKDDLDTSSDSVKLTEANLSETLLQQMAGTTPI